MAIPPSPLLLKGENLTLLSKRLPRSRKTKVLLVFWPYPGSCKQKLTERFVFLKVGVGNSVFAAFFDGIH